MTRSEGPFLRKTEPRQRDAALRFRTLPFNRRRVRRRNLGWPQHGILRENFAVHFRYEVILAGYVLPPDLSKFDALHSHNIFPLVSRVLTHPLPSQLRGG